MRGSRLLIHSLFVSSTPCKEHPSYLIRGVGMYRCAQSCCLSYNKKSVIMCARSHFDWPNTMFFWETLGTLPKWKYRGCSIQPTFIGYACSTLAKQILDKVLCYWEHLGNLGNMLRIALGTYGNPKPCNPIPPPQGKKIGPHGCMFGHLICCMRTLFLNLFVTILGLR